MLVPMLLLLFAPVLTAPVVPEANVRWSVAPVPRVLERPLQFASGNAKLRGTLYLPAGATKVPAVVLLHDASVGLANDPIYMVLARGLPRIGIAVAAFDRRGEGRSTGERRSATFETLAGDGVAAFNALRHDGHIDPKRIGFWGLSQGGWLSVLACSRAASCAFAVSVSAPLVTPADQMMFAVRNLVLVRGYSSQQAQAALSVRKAYDDYVRGKTAIGPALDAIGRVEHENWFSSTFLPTAEQLRARPQQSWRSDRAYDPVLPIGKLHVPSFFMFGAEDPWVPVQASVSVLQALMKKDAMVSYTVIPRANHRMRIPVKETMEYGPSRTTDSTPQSPDYFMALSSWLSRVVDTVRR